MSDLITTVAVINANYATKAELAAVNGKLDMLQQTAATKAELAVVNGKLDTLQQTSTTKAELAGAVYQLTWRMAGFAVAIVGAVAAVVRYA